MKPAASTTSSQAVPHELLLRQIPALKNTRYFGFYQSGRDRCLARALSGEDISQVPLFSHSQTYQSLFTQGWRSVNEQDIRLAKAEARYVRHA